MKNKYSPGIVINPELLKFDPNDKRGLPSCLCGSFEFCERCSPKYVKRTTISEELSGLSVIVDTLEDRVARLSLVISEIRVNLRR